MAGIKHKIKKVVTLISGISLAVLFLVVLTSAVVKQQNLKCKGVTASVDYESGMAFLQPEEIVENLNQNGNNLEGRSISSIDFKELENSLEKNPFVDHAEVYVNQQQRIHADIEQKRPILRILNNDGVSFYIGEKNEHIPLSNKFTAHVAVATGYVQTHVSQERDSAVQNTIYNVVSAVRGDKFLDALVDQIYVFENGEIDIFPRIGGHVIRMGNANEELENKFERLKIFYKEGLCKLGWSKYKMIDLRFTNQVVAVKNENI